MDESSEYERKKNSKNFFSIEIEYSESMNDRESVWSGDDDTRKIDHKMKNFKIYDS